jgi:RHS repeat-associated protein
VNAVEQKFNFVYDDGGRRERLKSFNGASLVTETIYGFDNANRLLNLEHLNPLNQILESIGYTYDANGNRTNMNRPSVTLPLPNPASNINHNEANQMLSFNDKNITYDNNGNMTSVINTCGTTNYTWDVRNRLTGISGFKPDCSALTASFKYDALNRRIEKTINGQTTKYLYDGLDIVQEINQDGTVKANYIRGLNIDEPLARIKSDGTIRYYQTDALGSVIALTDENGVVKTTYSYDPFGAVTIMGEASDNPFQFAGRENDGNGHLFERNRYYSYELLRYISQDPIGLAGGDTNFYVRVGNDPINWIDPWGLWSISIEGYYGLGGGLVFGKNPNGGSFVTWRFGYGIGGGVSFDPYGTSPGWDPCKKHGVLNAGIGGFAEAGAGVGPLGINLGTRGGINVENPSDRLYIPYFESPHLSFPIGWERKWRLRGGAAAGVEITFY